MKKKNIQNRFRSIMKLFIIVLIICFTGALSNTTAQDIRTRLKVEYLRKADNSKVLTAKLLLRQGRKYLPAPEMTVNYSVLKNEEELVIGDAVTDANGEAMFIISADYKLPVNEELLTVLMVSFVGNDSCRSSSSDVEVKDIDMQIELGSMEEKTVTIALTEKNVEGEVVPVVDEFVSISIERLYSLLPIGDGTTDENGMLEFTYEDEIPGDEDGDVNIVVKLEESDLYGTVEAEKQAKWGTPVDYSVDVSARALWSDQAPLWMLIAVFIVLGGAWFNFVLALVNLFKIKKAGTKV